MSGIADTMITTINLITTVGCDLITLQSP